MHRDLLVIIGLCLAAASALALGERQAERPGFYGADISMLVRFEELGAVYRDREKPADAIGILTRHGCNCFRLRLFVNPTMDDGVIQDLPYTVRLARRVTQAGAALLLDIHYSDTWADPGRQTKPAAWSHLGFSELEAQVESYTANVIKTLKDADCLPDIVQVGNEVTSGFLWPEGNISANEGGWDRFALLLKAAIRGVRQPLEADDSVRVMIHIDPGGSATATAWFFRNIEQQGVEYDLIGLSYYPWWHGSIADLQDNLRATARAFGKDIMIVETAYPWRKDTVGGNMAWPQTPEGQRQFLKDVIQSVRATPAGLGRGVLWWHPESIPLKGLEVWKGGNAALFDSEGNRLPALDAFLTR